MKKRIIITIILLLISVILIKIINYKINKSFIIMDNYSNEFTLDELPNIFLNYIKNLNLYNNEYVSLDTKVKVRVKKNERRRRTFGIIYIYGYYSSEQGIKELLESSNHLDEFDNLMRKKSLILFRKENIVGQLFIQSSNVLRLEISVEIPYIIQLDNDYNDETKYFFELEKISIN